MQNPVSTLWKSPVWIWCGVLITVFLTEIGIMLTLPLLMPPGHSRLFESAIDSIALTAVVGPVLWLSIVRPIREVLRIRTRYLSGLFSEIEIDRRQTAYDLHDGIGQPLSLLVSGLKSAVGEISHPDFERRLLNLQILAESALGDVKRLAKGLRPSLLDDLGLGPALERLVLDVRGNQSIDLTFDVEDIEGDRFAPEVETALFRIVQEALTNVVRHSAAKRADVRVWHEGEILRATIGDDGAGFDARMRQPLRSVHLGLTGMRERAIILGGTCTIVSKPGEGTIVQVSIPVQAETK